VGASQGSLYGSVALLATLLDPHGAFQVPPL